MIFYAGIGSRETPPNILSIMKDLAYVLATKGRILRSGGAVGADTWFETGCDLAGGNKEIYYAQDATPESMEEASDVHPNWGTCNEYVRKLHGRNAMIILGNNLETPVSYVVCWTSNGLDKCGTGLGIRLANKYDIPVYNLFHPIILKRVMNIIKHS